MLMVSTTGEHAAYYELDDALAAGRKGRCRPISSSRSSGSRRTASRRYARCCSWAGAGGSLRAGVTDNPVRLTRSVKDALTRVTSGGAPVYVWPGGGITFMVDVTQMPAGAFGYVPTPALVAPIEFTLRLSDYAALGGHMDHVRPLASLRGQYRSPPDASHAGTARMKRLPQIALLPDGKRLHLQDGPIDLIIEANGQGSGSARRLRSRGASLCRLAR